MAEVAPRRQVPHIYDTYSYSNDKMEVDFKSHLKCEKSVSIPYIIVLWTLITDSPVTVEMKIVMQLN